MKKKLLAELKSVTITFVATFVLTVLVMIQQDADLNFFDRVAVLSLIVAGARAAVKAIVVDLIPFVKGFLKK